ENARAIARKMQEKRSFLLEDVEIAAIFAGFRRLSPGNWMRASLFLAAAVCGEPQESNRWPIHGKNWKKKSLRGYAVGFLKYDCWGIRKIRKHGRRAAVSGGWRKARRRGRFARMR